MNPDLEREKSMNYYLSKRKRGKTSKWYVYFFDGLDTRKYTMSFSVELLRRKLNIKERTPLTREKEALVIVERAIEVGLIRRPTDEIPFTKYVLDFWDFDNSDYIRRRNLKSPNSISKDYALNIRGTFNKNAYPLLSKKLLVSQVTAYDIENVVNQMLDEGQLSNATIKRIIQSMAVPLREATRLKIVAHNPMDGVEPLTHTPEKRGIFTIDELKLIITYMRDKSLDGTIPINTYLAVALASLTGMRMGEICALCTEQIKFITDESAIITVDRAVNDYAGEKNTKGKRARSVPIPRFLYDMLIKEASSNPHDGSSLVFWSKKSATNPISTNFLVKQLYKAQEAIGITEKQRLERNLDFHSLRHTFNTNLRGRISEKSLRAVVGHESVEMSDLYTHATEEDVIAVGVAIVDIFKSIYEGKAGDGGST